MEQSPEYLLGCAVAFFIFFTILWCSIVLLISLMGGWRALAKRYPAKDMEVAGERWTMQSGALRILVRYRHILTIAANPRGLYLDVMFLFRPGHPPLFIPWEHIEIHDRPGTFGRSIQFVFTQIPGTNLTVRQELGARIAAAGQRSISMPLQP